MAVAAAACVGVSQAFVTPMTTVSAGATSAATRQTSSLTMAAENAYHKKDFWIAPSILAADMAKLGEEVDNAMSAGADIVHFDVMDNHYVPNLTIGPLVCKGLRDHGVTKPIDVHLMVSPVDRIVGDFAEAGASFITFHPEASPHVDRTLGLIKSHGCKAGTLLYLRALSVVQVTWVRSGAVVKTTAGYVQQAVLDCSYITLHASHALTTTVRMLSDILVLTFSLSSPLCFWSPPCMYFFLSVLEVGY